MAHESALVKSNTSLKSALWDLKVRLQFTGWLQYLPNAVAVVVFSTIAGIGGLIGGQIGAIPGLLVWTPLVLAAVLALNLGFDLVTVKFGVHPREATPRRLDHLDAFELMRARASCRSFQSQNLRPEDHEQLMAEVARQTDPGRLLGSAAIRFEYIAAPLTVWPVVGAHEFLVAIGPKSYDRSAILDVGRSLQKVVVHGTRMGLATCWIGPGADHDSILRHLGSRFDPERDHIVCVCAIGYASRFKPLTLRLVQLIQRNRLPIDALFFADPKLSAPLDPSAPPFAAFGRCYEVCEWAPSSYNAQPTRAAAAVDSHGEVTRFDFFSAIASRYYAPVAAGIWLANWELGCEALGIPGRFEILAPERRAVPIPGEVPGEIPGEVPGEVPDLPRYEISWVRDRSGPGAGP